jgi:hypothetical protein
MKLSPPSIPLPSGPFVLQNPALASYLNSLASSVQAYLKSLYDFVYSQPIPRVTTVASSQTPFSVAWNDFFIEASAGAASSTVVQLPPALGTGRIITVKKIDANAQNVAITAAGSDTIDGASPYNLSSQYSFARLIDKDTGLWRVS